VVVAVAVLLFMAVKLEALVEVLESYQGLMRLELLDKDLLVVRLLMM
jgi:hypothetical protein